MYHGSLLGFQFRGNRDNFFCFLIGKKENIIKKGIVGKTHRVHNSEQRVTETTCSWILMSYFVTL